jgi:hypothetical protein
MRFKKINISERSSNYEDAQKQSLESISSHLNDIGGVFDTVVELEQYILKDVRKQLFDFYTIRENKDEIIEKYGKDYYIENLFLQVVDDLQQAVNLSIENWNTEHEEFTIEHINRFINSLKSIYHDIKDLIDKFPNIKTFSAITDLIDAFGNFIVFKSINTTNKIEMLNMFVQFKSQLQEIEQSPSKEKKKNEKKKLTIDDL